MSKHKKYTEDKKSVIEFSNIPEKKSKELNLLLDEIVETLNGMGEAIKNKKSA